MEEAGSTKADSKGKYSFKLDDAAAPPRSRYVPRSPVFQDGSSGNPTPISRSTIFQEVEGIHYTVDFLRWKRCDQIHATRTFVMDNQSKRRRRR